MGNARLIANLALTAALLLADGAYGSNWPDWARGLLLGLAASITVNYTIRAAALKVTAERERDWQSQDAR